MTDQQPTPTPFAGAHVAADFVELEETMQVRSFHDRHPVELPPTEPAATTGPQLIAPAPQLVAPPTQLAQPEPAEQLPGEEFDLSRISAGDRPATATTGLRGALGKVGIKLAPSAAEQAQLAAVAQLRADETTIRQATWTRAVSVLVANKKGGSSKTPCAIALGGTLAAIRGGSVAIMEVSDDPGRLTFRAEGSPQLGIGELVRDVDQIRSAGQLAGYTAPQTSFASIIGTVGRRPPLSRDDVVRVAQVIDSYYSIRIMDSGNQPSSSAFEGAVETADVLVVPVMNSGDVVLEALEMLEYMRAAGGKARQLADSAIMLRVTDGRPEHPQVVERLTRLIDSAGLAQVYAIPYDAHIAERLQITLDLLAPATRAAFTAACAGVVRALQAAPTTANR